MQFIFHENAKDEVVTLNSSQHKHIFNIRRTNSNKILVLRNLIDQNIYNYKISSIGKKESTLILQDFEELDLTPKKYLHIGLCVIDLKNIEKILPLLNEIGVSKLSFIKCKYSQQQLVPNLQRLKKILINSSQQCGRSDIMIFESYDNVKKFIKTNPKSYMFNFSNNNIVSSDEINTILVGCEGGFSKNEIELFDEANIVGIKSNAILKSETSLIVVATSILLNS